MTWQFLTPDMAPFSIALALMVLIALLEVIGLMFGVAPSGLMEGAIPDIDIPDFDADMDVDGPDVSAAMETSVGPLSHLLSWLCVGKVPVLVLLVAFLTAFGLIGLAMQNTLLAMFGWALPGFVAAILTLIMSLPLMRYLGLGLAKVMPKAESEAVSSEGFIGKLCVITQGVAVRGLPAQAKLKDRYGQTHYLQVEPDEDDVRFAQGAEVLIVRQVGATFMVIESLNAALSSHGSEL